MKTASMDLCSLTVGTAHTVLDFGEGRGCYKWVLSLLRGTTTAAKRLRGVGGQSSLRTNQGRADENGWP